MADWLIIRRREIEAFLAGPRVHGIATSWPCADAMIEFRNLLLAILLVSCRGLCVSPLLRWIWVWRGNMPSIWLFRGI